MSEALFLAIPAMIVMIFAIFGGMSVHNRAHRRYGTAFVLCALASLGMYGAASAAAGWDGIVYLMVLIAGTLPAKAGLLIGGAVGLFTRLRLSIPS